MHREKALANIFTHFAMVGGLSPLKKATFDQIKSEKRAIDLQEFLHFCRHFDIPLSSKAQLVVFRRVVEKSPSGKFTCREFKDSL